MRLSKYFIVLITIVSLLLSGCGQKASEKTGTKGETGEKTIAFDMAQSPTNLDPAVEYNGWHVMKYGLGETLVRIGKGMKIEPWLAESWTKVDDVTWKIKIRALFCWSCLLGAMN